MKTLGNILWHFPFLGFVSAIYVYLLGLLLTITVIAAPIGLGLMELGKFLFWPFGNAMVSKSDLNIKQNMAWKAYSTIIMIIYFPFGLCLCIIGVLQVAGLFISIIGIPAALVVAKSLGTYLNPVNKKCVSSAVVDELEKRKAQQEIDKHL
ncbi:MAG: YccF domain-containing protein [Bacteroidota bacterium]